MKKQIIVLEIEIRSPRGFEEKFRFNDTMLRAIVSRLNVVYGEIFIWSADNHLAVWVEGDNAEYLLQAFVYHRRHFKKLQMKEGAQASDLLKKIIKGKVWNDRSMGMKLDSFQRGYALSKELDCLGTNLSSLLSESISLFAINAEISVMPYTESLPAPGIIRNGKEVVVAALIQSPTPSYRFYIN